MTSMIKKLSYRLPATSDEPKQRRKFFMRIACSLLLAALFTSCGVYTFRDVSIDYSKYKTIKVNILENKARYINPQLSPRLTEALRQKIASYTKLSSTNNDNADYVVKGQITGYDVSTSAISGQQSVGNRLTVRVHIDLLDNITQKTTNIDASRDFDFSASLTLPQAEGALLSDIIKNVSDEASNRMFSNW